MIPWWVSVRIQNFGKREFRFGVPLILVYLLWAPLVLLLLPFYLLILLLGFWHPRIGIWLKIPYWFFLVWCDLKGLLVEVQSPREVFALRVT